VDVLDLPVTADRTQFPSIQMCTPRELINRIKVGMAKFQTESEGQVDYSTISTRTLTVFIGADS
jgi:hypothetical protein